MQDARLPGTPKARSVIFLFMCGGVSHIDTFDPKDNKQAGKIMDAIGFGDNKAPMKRPVIPILRTYKHTVSRAFRFRTGSRTWARRSMILPWSARCSAIGRTTSPRSSKRQPETAPAVRTSYAWGAGCPMRWAPPKRICPPS